ncbi:hypothetical protein RvY_14469 [Ramazzottius varieornatus]|uniref:Uncharacterized protein n=1 Tax=Ramazzottius varieornatus TaxID=947166 RepID=A0A1D1VTE5_RAMVA|nr:hypothetical protein RvY_14469 [Ramazzottius varieornatus]
MSTLEPAKKITPEFVHGEVLLLFSDCKQVQLCKAGLRKQRNAVSVVERVVGVVDQYRIQSRQPLGLG